MVDASGSDTDAESDSEASLSGSLSSSSSKSGEGEVNYKTLGASLVADVWILNALNGCYHAAAAVDGEQGFGRACAPGRATAVPRREV